ncbi:E3 ubiquitin protein ligase DRIP2-like [Silene latifolia]|uniref:E3 ubiquitin protein ligase DRIP2-like n=1 Tax=Silene latifolia TaxID=37657 RepID=UPI003D76E707
MGMGLGSGQVVMVSRDKIMACMKCPLCNNLLNQATTISLCLHTFCRRCIYKRLSDDDVDSCPVCDINLGCIPVDKLRPDHSLQDIRAKVFPFKRRKVEAPEISPAISLPAKRKERSLSSLVVSTPRLSVQGGITGRRTRAGVRKGSGPRGASPVTEESPKKAEDSVEDDMDGSSSPETLNKIIQNKKQSSSARSSNDQICGEHMENNMEGREGKEDFWKPLNTLLEAANRTKFSKPGSQGVSHIQTDPNCSGGADACMVKIEIEENGHRAEGEKSKMPSTVEPVKSRRGRRANRKRLSGSAESCSSKFILNVARRNWRDGPIWFSLVASGDQKGVEPLPQVSASFLRVKDITMSVSSIQKYLMKKLDLANEEEVQVMCHGQPVMPQLKLSSLMDLWLRTSVTPKKVRSFVGQSAKDFTMVLSYSRKPDFSAS